MSHGHLLLVFITEISVLSVFVTEISNLLLSNSEVHMVICYQCLSLKFSVINTDDTEISVINTPVSRKPVLMIINLTSEIHNLVPSGICNSLFPSGPLALHEINSFRSLQEINLYIPSTNS